MNECKVSLSHSLPLFRHILTTIHHKEIKIRVLCSSVASFALSMFIIMTDIMIKNSSSNNGKTMLDLLMMIRDAGRVDWLMTRGLSSGGRHCIVSIAHSVNCEWLHANNEEESSHCWVCQKLLLPRHQLTNE